MAVIGFILCVLMIFVMIALNKGHRDETGVNMPSRNAMRHMRRRARKNGISEEQAYNDWLARKQKANRSG